MIEDEKENDVSSDNKKDETSEEKPSIGRGKVKDFKEKESKYKIITTRIKPKKKS